MVDLWLKDFAILAMLKKQEYADKSGHLRVCKAMTDRALTASYLANAQINGPY